MNYKKWLNINTQNLKNKVIILTGSTGGLGNEIANFLGGLNANIILADRDLEKSSKLKEELLKKYKDIKIYQIKLDLQDLDSVVNFIIEAKKFDCIDAIIHNAGVYNLPVNDEQNYYTINKVNYIMPYYITKCLLPKLKKSDFARVVVVGSIAYKYAKFSACDPEYLTCKKPNKIYGNSKRCLIYSMFELFKNEKKVRLSIVQPGVTPTNITRHFPKFIKALIKLPMKLIFNSPKKSSLCVIKGLFENLNYNEWIGPRYLGVWGKPKKNNLKNISNEEASQIFEDAEKNCDLIEKIK